MYRILKEHLNRRRLPNRIQKSPAVAHRYVYWVELQDGVRLNYYRSAHHQRQTLKPRGRLNPTLNFLSGRDTYKSVCSLPEAAPEAVSYCISPHIQSFFS